MVGCKLSKEDDSKDIDQRTYRSMIGSLLYVTVSRPDVKQAVGMVARFQSGPKETHVLAVKRIFRDLKGTMNIGLWYPSKKSFSLNLIQMLTGLDVWMTKKVLVEELSS